MKLTKCLCNFFCLLVYKVRLYMILIMYNLQPQVVMIVLFNVFLFIYNFDQLRFDGSSLGLSVLLSFTMRLL